MILTSLLYRVLMYQQNLTAWVPYILIIVFFRGIIVLFIYITSLSSNEPLFFSNNLFLLLGMINLLWALIIFFNKPNYFTYRINNINIIKYTFSIETIYKTYRHVAGEITLILISYLFIVLVVTVKICSIANRPLKHIKT